MNSPRKHSRMIRLTRISLRAIGSVVVTVPSVYYLIQPQIERYSGKKGGHGGHGEHGGEDGEHGDSEEENAEESDGEEEGGSAKGDDSKGDVDADAGPKEDKEEAGSSETTKEKSSSDGPDNEGANKSGPDTPSDKGSDDVAHETDSGSNVEGIRFKGATSEGTRDGEQGDTRKHIPDAKGGNKKRIESHYGKKQGEAQSPEQDPSNEDLVKSQFYLRLRLLFLI